MRKEKINETNHLSAVSACVTNGVAFEHGVSSSKNPFRGAGHTFIEKL